MEIDMKSRVFVDILSAQAAYDAVVEKLDEIPRLEGELEKVKQLIKAVGVVVELHEHIASLEHEGFLGHAAQMQMAMALVMTYYRTLYPKGDHSADGCGKGSRQDPDVDVLRESETRTDPGGQGGGETPHAQ